MRATRKHLTLVNRLLEKSQAGQLEWQETSIPNKFQLSFPDYSVTIRQEANNEWADDDDILYDYYIALINDAGQIVDEVDDNNLTQLARSLDANNGGYYAICGELFELARRIALGADKAVDNVLNQLG